MATPAPLFRQPCSIALLQLVGILGAKELLNKNYTFLVDPGFTLSYQALGLAPEATEGQIMLLSLRTQVRIDKISSGDISKYWIIFQGCRKLPKAGWASSNVGEQLPPLVDIW